MKNPKLKVRKLGKYAKLPTYAHPGDAGFDIYSAENLTLKPRDIKAIPTQISAEFPSGWVVLFKDKSGLALKNGLHVLGGVIDAGYRGEWLVIVTNHGHTPVKVLIGDKIAQGLIQSSPQAKITEAKSLSVTKRGKKGFGSTGKR